jgi:hypothetical protein
VPIPKRAINSGIFATLGIFLMKLTIGIRTAVVVALRLDIPANAIPRTPPKTEPQIRVKKLGNI